MVGYVFTSYLERKVMLFNDIKIGQVFEFGFDEPGKWIYVKTGPNTVLCVKGMDVGTTHTYYSTFEFRSCRIINL